MSLIVQPIQTQNALNEVKERYLKQLKDQAEKKRKETIKERENNKTIWTFGIAIMLVVSAICGTTIYFCSSMNSIEGVFAFIIAIVIAVFVIIAGLLVLSDNPIPSQEEIEANYKQDMAKVDTIKNETKLPELLSLVRTLEDAADYHEEEYDIFNDLICDLEPIEDFVKIAENNILSYEFDEEEEELTVTLADESGRVEKMTTECFIEYNINEKEDTLSLIPDDDGDTIILLKRPFVVKE